MYKNLVKTNNLLSDKKDMKMVDSAQFWGRVKNLLEQRGMTQVQLSEASGVLLNTIRVNISRGHLPSLENGLKIAAVLRTSVENLAYGTSTDNQMTKNALNELREKIAEIEATLS